ARCPPRIPAGPILVESLLDRHEALPGNIRRQLVAQQHLPLLHLPRRVRPATVALRPLLGIDVATPVGVGAGVQGVAEEVQHRRATGPPPFYLPAVRAP